MEIGRGAEAVIIREGDKIIKKRIKKSYRLKMIDEKLRKERNKREASLMERAKRLGVLVPKIFETKEFEIIMEFIEGEKLRDVLEERKEFWEKIGEYIAKLHKNNIIHGDLTTSNMIIRENKLYFIDFGLGFYSERKEDKAVDLHLLKRALESKHSKIWKEVYKKVIEGYLREGGDQEIVDLVEEIEKRGRYKKK